MDNLAIGRSTTTLLCENLGRMAAGQDAVKLLDGLSEETAPNGWLEEFLRKLTSTIVADAMDAQVARIKYGEKENAVNTCASRCRSKPGPAALIGMAGALADATGTDGLTEEFTVSLLKVSQVYIGVGSGKMEEYGKAAYVNSRALAGMVNIAARIISAQHGDTKAEKMSTITQAIHLLVAAQRPGWKE